jgi:hypothetical protein
VLAFSRVLNDQEVLIVANFNTTPTLQPTWAIIDGNLSAVGDKFALLYSNRPAPVAPTAVAQLAGGTVTINEADGSHGSGPVNIIGVTLQPMEVQVLRKR